ncbi:hypothetical protein ZHAS_00013649 [Anopheles sinensis]|uniref:Uncharacterized protein n=1 Tax=Anopheles sinensis TaxID=74873 RepID=A0A084W657_ANOSI|nr:hypothetical protein ZHAS_00013649 [Anopheles sinensis]
MVIPPFFYPAEHRSDTESAEMKQPVSKAQRFMNIFTQRSPRSGATERAVDAAPEVVDEQEGKLQGDQSPQKASKDDQTLVYAELELKPAEISFVNKPPASNESTEYAEILYVQQGGAGGVTEGEATPTSAAAQPRNNAGEDNRPVIDGSAPVKASSKNEKAVASGGK